MKDLPYKTKMSTPSEVGHWYAKDGLPRYTTLDSKNNERPTTLRDARKLGLVPSVTTITRILDKPGLANWLQDQVLWAALTLPRNEGEQDESYVSRIKLDAKERGKKAAERGTLLHGDVERSLQGLEHGHGKHIELITNSLADFGIVLNAGRAEHSFAHPDGFGGKIDWHNDNIVLDFKSKDRIIDGKRLAWDEHCMQLAAYAHGMNMPDPRALNVFVGVDDCEVRIHEWSQEELRRGREMFALLLQVWKLKNKFDPSL